MEMLKIGHTGITWGIPGDIEAAYREIADLGYRGFETFTEAIRSRNEKPGGYRQLVDRFGIPTCAGYCYKEWINPATALEELDEAKREADALCELPGATTLVLQAGHRPANGYAPKDFSQLADALNELGEHCRNIGLTAGLHPHTGTAVESRSDIETILGLLDPEFVGLAPDTGQLAKGGVNVVELIQAHRNRIVHVHLKDWNGRHRTINGREHDESGYLNYETVGDGILPISDVLNVLTSGESFAGWINVELDGTERSPRPAREAAARSREHLAVLIGENHFTTATV